VMSSIVLVFGERWPWGACQYSSLALSSLIGPGASQMFIVVVSSPYFHPKKDRTGHGF